MIINAYTSRRGQVMENITNSNDYCSFCGGHIDTLEKIDGATSFKAINDKDIICSNCIGTFADKLDDDETIIDENGEINIDFSKTPKDLVEELNKIIIGQDAAKRYLALAAYQHYQRVNSGQTLDKNNILLVGPTGSGKTLLAKTLAKALNVPCLIVRANSITETGYVGDDVESIIEGLLEKAGGNPSLAEVGIVFIDEIDKIAKAPSGTVKDVSGLGTQTALLTILEDDDVVAYKKNEFRRSVTVNTKNILFIASGAFSGISEIANKRDKKSTTSIGFTAVNTKAATDQEFVMSKLQNEDFVEFGLIPEFIGRFPIISSLKGLTELDIQKIITEPENSIFSQYKQLFKNENTTLTIEPEAFIEISKLVVKNKTGARGLRGIFNHFFADALFECAGDKSSKSCSLTAEDVRLNRPSTLKFKKTRSRINKATA
jgi:ATP-dependent Clp protease ATP-binding subunit ClpX